MEGKRRRNVDLLKHETDIDKPRVATTNTTVLAVRESTIIGAPGKRVLAAATPEFFSSEVKGFRPPAASSGLHGRIPGNLGILPGPSARVLRPPECHVAPKKGARGKRDESTVKKTQRELISVRAPLGNR